VSGSGLEIATSGVQDMANVAPKITREIRKSLARRRIALFLKLAKKRSEAERLNDLLGRTFGHRLNDEEVRRLWLLREEQRQSVERLLAVVDKRRR